ncbi:MAG TPA: ABC transporter ATP-binding protein [Candidatus Limnocylindrales bacterium]|nr:ABC transporter ATP-binding protein [Candidatus Limnocylindrales bacterium]
MAVRATDLTRRFESVVAVSGIDLEVASGTILGIIGPSGSGKTTTIRMITGSLAPSAGEVLVLGVAPARFDRRIRERIGYMPQSFILYPDLTVKENVDFVASLFGVLLFRRRRRTRQVLELLDLWSARGRRAGKLSGGMQRRLELACALVHEPELLILDEPTAGVDPMLRRTIWDELHRLRDSGVTALVTTQYVTEAEECDAVALIADGAVLALGTPEELRRRAFGGEVIEVETKATFDASSLAANSQVERVQQTGLREFRVVVEDAGSATPEIVEAVTAAGGEIDSVREYRRSFEEVFTRLVEHGAESADSGPSAQEVRDIAVRKASHESPADSQPEADPLPAPDPAPEPHTAPDSLAPAEPIAPLDSGSEPAADIEALDGPR